jgi:hypothetical protein
MLVDAFNEVFRVIKPGGHMTVTFHSREIKYWNSLIYAIQQAGFQYVKAIYQVPQREYTNWINRRKPGTMSGDIYITFFRPAEVNSEPLDFQEIQEVKKLIADKAKEIILYHDGEATFEQLVRGVTLELVEEEAMHSEQVRDINYERIFDQQFERVSRSKVWTLDKWEDVDEIDYIPLQRRVRWLIDSVFSDNEDSKVTLDDILSRVFTTLENSRTPENEDIHEVLQEVARPTEADGQTVWRRKETQQQTLFNDTDQDDEESEATNKRRQDELDHDRIISQLARIGGRGFGLDIWIGEPETRKNQSLREAKSIYTIPGDIPETTRERLRNVDIIWFDGERPVALFEVEHSTPPQDGITRMANIYQKTHYEPKSISVFPSGRMSDWEKTVRRPAIQKLISGHEFHALTYVDIMSYTDQVENTDSTSIEEFYTYLISPTDIE